MRVNFALLQLIWATLALIPALYMLFMATLILPYGLIFYALATPGFILYVRYWKLVRGRGDYRFEKRVWIYTLLYNLLLAGLLGLAWGMNRMHLDDTGYAIWAAHVIPVALATLGLWQLIAVKRRADQAAEKLFQRPQGGLAGGVEGPALPKNL